METGSQVEVLFDRLDKPEIELKTSWFRGTLPLVQGDVKSHIYKPRREKPVFMVSDQVQHRRKLDA